MSVLAFTIPGRFLPKLHIVIIPKAHIGLLAPEALMVLLVSILTAASISQGMTGRAGFYLRVNAGRWRHAAMHWHSTAPEFPNLCKSALRPSRRNLSQAEALKP